MSEILEFDTVILGGGPAGLAAGIYAARATGNIAIVDVSMFGGQPSNYLELENYPAFPLVGGYDLMEKMFPIKMPHFKNINVAFCIFKFNCYKLYSSHFFV